jgi:hypothetical protein
MAISKITSSGLAGDKYNVMTAGNNYYEPIATTLLTSTSATITFSNIPQGYKHLQIRGIARNTDSTAGSYANIRLNGDANSNYATHIMGVFSPTVKSSYAYTSATSLTEMVYCNGGGSTAAAFGGTVLDIIEYTNTNKYKTLRGFTGWQNNTTGNFLFNSGLWMSTAAINSIVITSAAGVFSINTRFSLYGLKG